MRPELSSYNNDKSMSQRLQELEDSRRTSSSVPEIPEFLKPVSVGKKDEFKPQQPQQSSTEGFLPNMENDFGNIGKIFLLGTKSGIK